MFLLHRHDDQMAPENYLCGNSNFAFNWYIHALIVVHP